MIDERTHTRASFKYARILKMSIRSKDPPRRHKGIECRSIMVNMGLFLLQLFETSVSG